jgi:hypothetical protein
MRKHAPREAVGDCGVIELRRHHSTQDSYGTNRSATRWLSSAESCQFPLKQTKPADVVSQLPNGGMRKTLAVLATVAAVGATSMTARPAEARGWGPGLAFSLAAGALAAGAYGAWGPYYGPRYYGYYGPAYYGPAYAYYGPGPYAYDGGPYYYHRHWRHHW